MCPEQCQRGQQCHIVAQCTEEEGTVRAQQGAEHLPTRKWLHPSAVPLSASRGDQQRFTGEDDGGRRAGHEERFPAVGAVLEGGGLRLQIEACDEKLLRAQEEVQRLREYKDRQRPTFLLQIAALQRQILRLSQTNKEQEADTELLADTEIQKCLEKHQKLQFQALQKIADSPIAQIPLSLRRMCLENHRMKQQIYMYKQEMGHLQEQISKLQHMGNDLQNCWVYETRSAWKMLVEKSCRCAPNDDFVLDLPI
ncbi:uncharacterized protein C20orf96 homolog isoform X4 [Xenopus tropicalis]|uniref:Uncharacterized protein C20orf96 homolog isoform X4 n=1 Tax=Xenopus tropicalis TaxID=8364 RepID=A0A8J1J0H8_XENTR|nr:uncharacterized protein C20orf96 homolog isoform X4 [Xenopus tropicalis]